MGKFMLMPKLDMSMEQGDIVKWMCNVGDEIKRGDIVVEVETGKVSLEVDNPTADGTILALYAEEGETVAVNMPLIYIGEKDEKAPSKEEALEMCGIKDEGPKEEAVVAEKEEVKETSKVDYDLAVIGAGPGGYVCAIRAAQLGAKVVIFEKENLGGVCLNKGCIPTKSLVKNAEVLREVKNAKEMGIEIKSFKADFAKAIERKNSVVKTLTGGVGSLLKKNKVEVVKAQAEISDKNTVKAGGKDYNVANIVIAVGSESVNIPIENDKSVEVYDSEGMLNLEKLPKDLVIIGGGVIGCEMAVIFNEYGVNVTIVEMLNNILAMADDDVIKLVTDSFKESGINVITGVGAKAIKAGKVVLSDSAEVKADAVLMSVGRKPNKFNDKAGVALNEKGFVKVDENLRTNVENIYAIGDVTGKSMLAHTASRQAIVVAEKLFAEGEEINYADIPSCVFTYPEAAWIGITERDAKEKKIPYKASKMNFTGIGKALAMAQTKGFVKVITDERFDEIIGVHIVGMNASDIIAQGAIAMTNEITASEIANTIFAHPTLSEGFMEACEGIMGKMIHG